MTGQLDLFDVTASPVGEAVAYASDKLPEAARTIEVLVCTESMVRFVMKFGGIHLDFPRHIHSLAKSEVVARIAEEIGMADALKIAAYYAGSRLTVPMCTAALKSVRNISIRAALDRNVPAHELARKWRIHERQIWRIAKQPD